METFDIVVCDDNIEFANILCEHLKAIEAENKCSFNITMLYDAKKLTEYCITHKVDIILTDIDMPDDLASESEHLNLEGFKAVEDLQKQNIRIDTIFVSMHEEYGYKAFQYKPYAFVSKKDLGQLYPEMAELIDRLRVRRAAKSFTSLHIEDKIYPIDVNDILYFKNDKHYVSAYSWRHKIGAYRCPIKEVYAQLASAYYIFVHKSYLVNCRYIKIFDSSKVELMNGLTIGVTRDTAKLMEAQKIFMTYKRSLR